MRTQDRLSILSRHVKLQIVFGVLVALLIAIPSTFGTAHADTITVNTNEDANQVCDTHCSLREAIAAANPGDTIKLPAGTYTLIPGFALMVNKDLTIEGDGAESTIIQAAAERDAAFHGVFQIIAGDVTLSGVTIRHGVDFMGGGVGVSGLSTSVTILDSIITANSAFLAGGGIANDATLNIINTEVTDNASSFGGGGGIANLAELSISGSVVSNNTSVQGGGIQNAGALRMTDTTVAENVAQQGGGIYLDFAEAYVSGSTIRDNEATLDGGGAYVSVGTLEMTNSTVSGNVAAGLGGGVFVSTGGTVNLNNATIAYNAADSGGLGTGSGGGISNEFGGTVNTQNSIFAWNTDAGGSPNCAGSVASLGHNLFEDVSGCNLGNESSDIFDEDPLIGPLQNNGYLTDTHALNKDSPAIDAGNPDGCTDSFGNLLAHDQRQEIRPVDGNGDGNAVCDIGAYEYKAAITLFANADSFIKHAARNMNEGDNPVLRMTGRGRHRTLVQFDLSEFSTEGLSKATLVLTIDESKRPSRWGKEGSALSAYSINSAWAEGNGMVLGVPRSDLGVPRSDKDRGNGPGVTWNCATDLEVANTKVNCDSRWGGGEQAISASTSPDAVIQNRMTGELTWDVTQDVLNDAKFGWLIYDAKGNSKGVVHFYSREGATAAGDDRLAPRLILEFGQ